MKKFSLLALALVVVFISLLVFGVVLLGKENSLKYWGNNLDGNSFWLHPQNYNLVAVSAIKHYEGKLVSYTTPKQGDWDITLMITGDDSIERETTVKMPSKIQSDRIFVKEAFPLDKNGQITGFSTSKYSLDDLILALEPERKVDFNLAINLDGSRYISEFSIHK